MLPVSRNFLSEIMTPSPAGEGVLMFQVTQLSKFRELTVLVPSS